MYGIELWLHAVTEDVPSEELRAFYKANETPLLDDVLARSPSVRLGATEVSFPENQHRRGPVGRLDDVLSLRGTATWPPMLPLLDAELEHELINAFRSEPTDPPYDVLPLALLNEFLALHLGSRLATSSRPRI